jgi:hypothetical protein
MYFQVKNTLKKHHVSQYQTHNLHLKPLLKILTDKPRAQGRRAGQTLKVNKIPNAKPQLSNKI